VTESAPYGELSESRKNKDTMSCPARVSWSGIGSAPTPGGGAYANRSKRRLNPLKRSHGQVLSLLLAARLCQPTALINLPAWAEKSGADILWDLPAGMGCRTPGYRLVFTFDAAAAENDARYDGISVLFTTAPLHQKQQT
jgi:hypothetical protein